MFDSLREYATFLEKENELLRVKKEVTPDWEIGAFLSRIEETQRKALFFERIKGYYSPGIGNVYASKKNMFRAIGKSSKLKEKEFVCSLADQLFSGQTVKPKIVSDAPFRELIVKGDNVDVQKEVPACLWNELERTPSVNAGAWISRDPETGLTSLSPHTFQILDKRRISTLIGTHRRIRANFNKKERKGEPLDVAIAIGVEPAVTLTTGGSAPADVDKMEMACRMKGKPIELAKCETNELYVPASSEVVVEGKMLPNLRGTFGYFGDYVNTYIESTSEPVVEITAITRREKPLHHFIHCVGWPPAEEGNLCSLMSSACKLGMVRKMVPQIEALNITLNSCYMFHIVASVRNDYEGVVMRAMDAIWAVHPQAHTVTIVDDDVDPFDFTQVEFAASRTVSPHKDVMIFPEVNVTERADPTSRLTKTGAIISRMGVNATRGEDWRYTSTRIHPEALKRITSQWDSYFR